MKKIAVAAAFSAGRTRNYQAARLGYIAWLSLFLCSASLLFDSSTAKADATLIPSSTSMSVSLQDLDSGVLLSGPVNASASCSPCTSENASVTDTWNTESSRGIQTDSSTLQGGFSFTGGVSPAMTASASFTLSSGAFEGALGGGLSFTTTSGYVVTATCTTSLFSPCVFNTFGLPINFSLSGTGVTQIPNTPSGTVQYVIPAAGTYSISWQLIGGTGEGCCIISPPEPQIPSSISNSINVAFQPEGGGPTCAQLLTGAVNPVASGPNIDATFTPNNGASLQEAAKTCGFTDFDWAQKVTHQNDPSMFLARNIGGAFAPVSGPVNLTSSWTPYSDPPQGGGYVYGHGTSQVAPDFSYPFYYDVVTQLPGREVGGVTLTFHDFPEDFCLPGGLDVETLTCQNTSEPPGSYGGYETHLAGVNADGSGTDLGIAFGFSWISTFNGATGFVATKKTDEIWVPGDGGTGQVTITNIGGVTQTPPSVSCAAAPNALWPPNGNTGLTTISGRATAGTSPVGATSYVVMDSQSSSQQTGTVTTLSDGTFSFTVPLVASRAGNIKSGRQYTIAVTAKDAIGNQGSCSAVVTVPHDQGNN